MKTIAVAIVIALILIYNWGRKRIKAIAAEYHKEKMKDKTVLEELIRKAWYGNFIAREHPTPEQKEMLEKEYDILDATYTYSEKRFELPITVARLSELAKLWDESTEAQKASVHRWLDFLSVSS